MDRTAEPTIESRNRAEATLQRLTENMTQDLRQAWQGARMQMGVVRAAMLLEDTERHYRRAHGIVGEEE